MKVVIDTSSLMALVRYYLPFDNDDSLKNFIESKIDSGEIIILDKVIEESKYQAKGIILKTLGFLSEKSKHTKSNDLLPDKKFFNMLEHQFCIQVKKAQINATEFENQKRAYLESADAKLILYCKNIKDNDPLGVDKPILVTEETASENDNKLFKKIPLICDILDINTCSLSTLLQSHFNLKLSEFLK